MCVCEGGGGGGACVYKDLYTVFKSSRVIRLMLEGFMQSLEIHKEDDNSVPDIRVALAVLKCKRNAYASVLFSLFGSQ